MALIRQPLDQRHIANFFNVSWKLFRSSASTRRLCGRLIAVSLISERYSIWKQSRRSRLDPNTSCCILLILFFPSRLSITSSSVLTLSVTIASTIWLCSSHKFYLGLKSFRMSVLRLIASQALSFSKDILSPWGHECLFAASVTARWSFRDRYWMLWNMTLMNSP